MVHDPRWSHLAREARSEPILVPPAHHPSCPCRTSGERHDCPADCLRHEVFGGHTWPAPDRWRPVVHQGRIFMYPRYLHGGPPTYHFVDPGPVRYDAPAYKEPA